MLGTIIVADLFLSSFKSYGAQEFFEILSFYLRDKAKKVN